VIAALAQIDDYYIWNTPLVREYQLNEKQIRGIGGKIVETDLV
jgi:hypothetical protein